MISIISHSPTPDFTTLAIGATTVGYFYFWECDAVLCTLLQDRKTRIKLWNNATLPTKLNAYPLCSNKHIGTNFSLLILCKLVRIQPVLFIYWWGHKLPAILFALLVLHKRKWVKFTHWTFRTLHCVRLMFGKSSALNCSDVLFQYSKAVSVRFLFLIHPSLSPPLLTYNYEHSVLKISSLQSFGKLPFELIVIPQWYRVCMKAVTLSLWIIPSEIEGEPKRQHFTHLILEMSP